ncbi:hypothetical protein PL81_14650 [Streptomyces sp. RSD-27]|nr:hypothetical protein PL81_14650 [Streptomyces sp. RSD-27]
MSAYIDKITSELTPKQAEALTATAASDDGRLPHTVHARTLDSLYGKRLLRKVTNRKGGFDWFVLSYNGKRVAAALAERAAVRAARPASTRAKALRSLQHADAVQLFAALHPAARRVVDAYQRNAIDSVVQGGTRFTPEEIWRQIGVSPGQYLAGTWETDPEEWATPDGVRAAWEHVNGLADVGELTMTRWDELVAEGRAILAAASTRTAPVVMTKQPASWQVLYFAESPLNGERWADLPVHSVVRTSQLRAGQDWTVVDAQLTAQGLKRYGFPVRPDDGYPVAVSAGHALELARELWEAEGPHALWFSILADEELTTEAQCATYDPPPSALLDHA